MTRLSITTAPKGAAPSRSSPARRQRRAACQAQDGPLPERLISLGSGCYFPAALLTLLLLLSLDLPKHPLCPPAQPGRAPGRGALLPAAPSSHLGVHSGLGPPRFTPVPAALPAQPRCASPAGSEGSLPRSAPKAVRSRGLLSALRGCSHAAGVPSGHLRPWKVEGEGGEGNNHRTP